MSLILKALKYYEANNYMALTQKEQKDINYLIEVLENKCEVEALEVTE